MVSALLVLMVTAIELGMREAFYRISGEAPGLLLITILTLLFAAVGLWKFRDDLARRPSASRIMVPIALASWGWLCGIQWPGGRGSGLVLLGIIGILAWRLSNGPWAVLRRALTAAALIFVLSQPILAFWHAPNLQWPRAASAGLPSRSGPAPEITVVVLLDELSANAAGPIAEAMSRSGYPVLRHSVQPVGDGTAKVVPSLIAHHVFAEAKPCSWHTVCSGASVLDLDRVSASRPDIDIVGFYFPYCAIGGLRSCEVLSPSQPYLDLSRWRCAAQRRSDWLAGIDGEAARLHCAELNGQVWASLGARVEAAIWRAPIWDRGGLLYVHAPLPHPPGEGGSGTLEQHYRANLGKAARLVGDLAERLAAQKRAFSLIVFSDHPLRSSFWCHSTQYRQSCPPDAALLDERVPLLATGIVDPGLGKIRNNMDLLQFIGTVGPNPTP